MDKIKRILLVNIPTGKCNFKCPYCFISQVDAWKDESYAFSRTQEEIAKAFAMERFGGPCFMNLCSRGETLIYPQVVAILRAILEQGHYVEVVTNGSLSKRFEEISKFPSELLEHLSFKFSFHYTELKRMNLFDVFFSNIEMMKKAGASFTVELTPVDEEEEYIDEIKEMCIKRLGAFCHTTIARDDRNKSIPVLSKHTKAEYYNIWSTFDSGMMEFKNKVFQEKRTEFCYAGDWSLYINLFTGDIQKCYCAPVNGNIYDFSKPIKYEAIGQCPISHCYNAHALMTFGLLPEVKTPSYTYIRNRVCEDGSEWLQPKVKEFYSSKLIESNCEYDKIRKKKIVKNTKSVMRRIKIYRKLSAPLNCITSHLSREQKSKIKRIIGIK